MQTYMLHIWSTSLFGSYRVIGFSHMRYIDKRFDVSFLHDLPLTDHLCSAALTRHRYSEVTTAYCISTLSSPSYIRTPTYSLSRLLLVLLDACAYSLVRLAWIPFIRPFSMVLACCLQCPLHLSKAFVATRHVRWSEWVPLLPSSLCMKGLDNMLTELTIL